MIFNTKLLGVQLNTRASIFNNENWIAVKVYDALYAKKETKVTTAQ